jgi:hypothetical protein
MKRWVLTVAALLAVAGLAHAEYVIIVANVGQTKAPPPAGGVPGVEGGPMGGGPMGFGPPPGAGGGPRGGAPPGPMGGGGSGFGPPPGMNGPRGGGAPPGPMGGGSGFGPPPGMGGMFGYGEGVVEDDPDPTALYVVAVVEAKASGPLALTFARGSQIGYQPIEIQHEFGKTVLCPSDRVWITAMPNGKSTLWPSALRRWKVDYDKVMKEVPRDGKPAVEDLVRLAKRALDLGLLNEYTTVMDNAVEVDKTHSTVATYIKVRDDLAKPLPPSKSAAEWKGRLNPSWRIKDGVHYTLLHLAPKDDSTEVVSRLNRLEDSLKGFYAWFTLNGIALPAPKERLVAILVDRPNEFTRIHQTFDGQPLVSDGFHARRDNLTVFSAVRTDEPYTAFTASMKQDLVDKDIKVLLRGNEGRPRSIQDIQLQTKVLMQKALERDGELATVSHEVPRQLLATAGLMPRNVAAPEWAVFGIGSFFETPRGAPWSSYGVPGATLLDQHNYLLNYKLWAKGKKLDKPAVQLEKCVSDTYFRTATAEKDKEKEAVEMLKARTHAWALTYFLAKTRLDGLLAFYREMGKLPRDVEFDGEVLLATFGRAFGLADRDGKLNRVQFAKLANEWHNYMTNTTMELEEVVNMVRKGQVALKEGKHPGANVGSPPPGAQGGPGGAPPGAGGPGAFGPGGPGGP